MNLDRRQFLAAVPALCTVRAWCNAPAPPIPPHPHAALFLYTEPKLRSRHTAIVQQALQQRSRAHTSGWQDVDGKPKLALGAVNQRARFWSGEVKGKAIDRTWPFAAVLEYDGSGQPLAYLDCFRRAHDSSSDDGWLLDPGVGYVEHHNAQIVASQDDRFAYLAVPDTPTGGHVGDTEFVIRARVRWADGRTAQLGWWLWFDAGKNRKVAEWRAQQVPLVDWRVTESTPKLGATAVASVADPDRELAVWGTDRVFRFPVIPAGLTPGRGRT